MKRTLLVVLVAAAAAAAVLSPVLLLADAASCSVNVSSYADSILNPPKGEDTEFFVSTGGVPNIMFVLDTSTSMRRLPPDGASSGWGSFEKAGNATAGAGFGCSNAWANNLRFTSPCGTTTLDGEMYDAGSDYAEAKDPNGDYCPHMVSGNQAPDTTEPGFDPDFYPTFFDRARVFHDTIAWPVSSSDGWSDTGTNPQAEADVAGFCSRATWTAAQQTSCAQCMSDEGYWFDGSYLSFTGSPSCGTTDDCKKHGYGTCIADATGLEFSGTDDGTAHCKIPNVWFSGNFLNFQPPKFIIARKVLKDVLMTVRKIRLGLTVFADDGDGGDLLEALNPPCNLTGSPSSFDSNRGAVKNAINGNSVNFSGLTPLAETLLDVGKLYLKRSETFFGPTWDDNEFREQQGQNVSMCFSCQASAVLLISDGAPSGDGDVPGTGFASAAATLEASNAENALAGMAGFNITGISSADCPVCETEAEAPDTTIPAGACLGQQSSGACDDDNSPVQAWLPKVAWYLKHFDLRPDTEEGADGLPMKGKQGITTYTIGLGTRGNASLILQHAAEAGGGLYNGGSTSDVTDARALRDAILRVLEDVNTRSTSFGAASLSTLQIGSSQGVLIPRFEPSRSAHWDGHLYNFDLFSEFGGGCTPADPATSGPANGDYDCDGKCASVFLKDKDGAFIQEDSTGAFRKNLTRTLAACGNGSQCDAADCSGPDPTAPAKPFWDAGSKLAPVKTTVDPVSGITTRVANPDFASALEWNTRAIFTVLDDSADGKFTSADTLVDLRDAYPSGIASYLNIEGTSFCGRLAARLTAAGNTAGATINTELSTGTYTACAKAILDFVRGADIFNERRCTTFPGTYCTRPYQLGDVFHSSPQEVWPPLPSDGFACPRGLNPQCLTSLFSPSIQNPAQVTGNANAYDDYAKSARYKGRHKFALVGANDGMLHAFRMDRADARAGEEIWAFIPPDLLPKLKLLLESVHHFYVDATPMVRDVWLDGVANQLPSGTYAENGIREGKEFHTVAIVGERRGGTHYFALDVTDASDDLDAEPKFLWLYPQPDDPESLAFGETYVEFVPKPPPIGPVRLDKGEPPCTSNYREYQTGGSETRCFEERWIVFLSGGFDPQYTKGRGVHMVDVKTGQEIWDFSQPSGAAGTCDADDDPRCHLNYPVAATVGMMMWGKQEAFLSAAAVDGYFDTATFGDTGGQLWTLRFNDPGKGWAEGQTGKVTNWVGARSFQHGLNADTPPCGLGYCDGQPFFYISSNLPLAANGLYRTLNGTGDRFNLLDPLGGTCGPDNIRACLIKGCTVTLADGTGVGPGAVYGVEPLLGTHAYRMDHPALCTAVDPATYVNEVTASSGTACTTVVSRIDGLTITCPSTKTCSGDEEVARKRAAVSCSGDGCEPAAWNEFGIAIDTEGNPDKKNWFFSVQVFETTGTRRIFRTPEEARNYDAARLDETDLTLINDYDEDATHPVSKLATPEGPGWRYFFDHGKPSTISDGTVAIAGVQHDIYRTDERLASVSQVEAGCAFWSTMQTGIPVGAVDDTTGCPVDSPCKAGRAQLAYVYGAQPGTGGLCLRVNDALAREQKSETLAPPHIGKLVAYVAEGQVSFGLTAVRVPQGGANVSLGEVQDLASPVQWLPVDRETHACRHAPQSTPPSQDVCR